LCIYSYLGCKKNLGPPEHKIKINFDLSLKVYNAALTMLKKKKLGQFSLRKKNIFSSILSWLTQTKQRIVAHSLYYFFG